MKHAAAQRTVASGVCPVNVIEFLFINGATTGLIHRPNQAEPDFSNAVWVVSRMRARWIDSEKDAAFKQGKRLASLARRCLRFQTPFPVPPSLRVPSRRRLAGFLKEPGRPGKMSKATRNGKAKARNGGGRERKEEEKGGGGGVCYWSAFFTESSVRGLGQARLQRRGAGAGRVGAVVRQVLQVVPRPLPQAAQGLVSAAPTPTSAIS